MTTDLDPVERRLRSARLWARQGGAEALDVFEEIEAEWKGDELITESDRRIETHLRTEIKRKYPSDAVIGEEFDEDSGESEFTWYLDPIDGTAAYSMGLPIWGVSLGLYRKNQPVAGVLLAPFMKEEFHGTNTTGPHINDEKSTFEPVSSSNWTSETLLCVTSDAHRAFDITFPGKCRSLGSAAYQMALVTDGRAVGALCGRLNIWDMAGVLGLASGVPLRMLTVEGDEPDWNSILAGELSPDPLLFTHAQITQDLLVRITPK